MDGRIYFEKFLSEDDFKYFSKLVFNEDVMAMNYGRVFSDEEATYVYKWILKRSKDIDEFGDFKILQKSTNGFIGYGSLTLRENSNEVEIEYMILPQYWRNRYGSEIVMELLKRVTKANSIHKVIANVKPDNIGSKKILINNGFTSCKVYENPDDGSPVEMFIKVIV